MGIMATHVDAADTKVAAEEIAQRLKPVAKLPSAKPSLMLAA